MTTTDLAVQSSGLIQQTARDLDAAFRIAEGLGRTSFVPQHFRGKTEDAMAAVLYGQTIGMDPITALQNLYVIGGKPALYSRPMVGIVLAQGHEIWTEVDTAERVVVAGRRKGSEHIERSEWTIERARQAGYTNNKKYQSDPQAMLYARASGDVARKVAPDALLGMAYNVEELEAAPDRGETAPVRVEAAVGAPTTQSEPAPRSKPVITEQQLGAVLEQIAQAQTRDDLDAVLTAASGVDFADHAADVRAIWDARAAELAQPSAEPTQGALDEPIDAEVEPEGVPA